MSTTTKLGEPHDVLTQDEAGFVCWKDTVPTPYPGPDIGIMFAKASISLIVLPR